MNGEFRTIIRGLTSNFHKEAAQLALERALDVVVDIAIGAGIEAPDVILKDKMKVELEYIDLEHIDGAS